MKIYKITEASKYLGISINSLKTLANNGKINSFKTTGEAFGTGAEFWLNMESAYQLWKVQTGADAKLKPPG